MSSYFILNNFWCDVAYILKNLRENYVCLYVL
jgi:hypothetical protein